MNPTEAAELLGHAAAFDNRKPSAAAAIAWAASLHDVPLDADTKAAVAVYYTTAPKDPDAKLWVLPHHVRTLRAKIRSARLVNFQYEPVGDETTGEYLARYRRQVQAIASGRVAPPAGRLALTGGPHRGVAKALNGVGWRVPQDDDEELVETVRRAGPLGVRCPACNAAVGRPCKTPGGSEKQPLGKPRVKPHSARFRAAAGEAEPSAEQRAAEEERRREASRRAVARMRAAAESEAS